MREYRLYQEHGCNRQMRITDILFHQRKSSIIRNVRRIKMRKLLKERLRGVMIWRKLLKHQKHQRLICFIIQYVLVRKRYWQGHHIISPGHGQLTKQVIGKVQEFK